MSMPETLLDPTVQPATLQPVSNRPQTVLLVEDDAAVRRYLEIILRRAGYEVLTTANGLEAIKAALSTHVDAVVTDALMPYLSGHELCRYLRARPELSGLPILLLSGLDAPEQSEHADAHLTKPVRPEVLTDRLASLLRTARRN